MIRSDYLKLTNQVQSKLLDLYSQNFKKAGVEDGIAEEIIRLGKDLDERNIPKLNSLFRKAKKQAHTGVTEITPMDLFDLSNVKTILDFGANKLRMLNQVGYKHPNIKELIAVDVVDPIEDFAYPNRSRYIKIGTDRVEIDLEDYSVDLINVQFVLHHVKDEETIEQILKEFHRILRPSGRVILWEESFEDKVMGDDDIEELVRENNEIGIETDFELTKQFMELREEEKWGYIFLNDWIINVNNEHMQWSMMYKKWSEWEEIFINGGFHSMKMYNLGVRLNGLIKCGVHIVGEFGKQVVG